MTVGFTSGTIPSVAANRILLKTISVVGIYWVDYWNHVPALIRDVQAELERLAPRPLIGKVFPFRALPDALDAVLDRAYYGKHVIVME